MWQKCPVCNGLCTIPSEFTVARTTCTVCGGTKIISEVTGLPPVYPAGNELTTQQPKEKE